MPWLTGAIHHRSRRLVDPNPIAAVPRAFGGGDAPGSMRLGSAILVVNAALLSLFSLSCNSLRHLVGGRVDCFSCTRRRRVQHSLWQRITTLNVNHMGWAWVSFFSVVLADLYIRLLALGVITDPAIYF